MVGEFLGDLDATLHVHHDSEDHLLWDVLEQRAPGCALHVGQMRAHHARVAELTTAIAPLRQAWRSSADPGVGEELALGYEELLEVLKVHLRREVVEMVPVAEKVITAREWSQLAEHSMGAIPRSRLMVQLGMLLAVSPPQDREAFRKALPAPVRLLYRFVGRRQFETYFRPLFPGRPVMPTT